LKVLAVTATVNANSVAKGNTTKVGTERVKGTEKKSGGGFSLGF